MFGSLALQVIRDAGLAPSYATSRMVLRQGESAEINCTLRYSDAEDWSPELSGGYVVFAAARRLGSTPVLSRQLDVVLEDEGTLTLLIAASETAALAAGEYVWDIWYEDADGNRYPTIGLSTLSILAAVVLPGTLVTPLPAQLPVGQGPPGADGANGADGAPGADGAYAGSDIEEKYVTVTVADGETMVITYDDPFTAAPLLDVSGTAFCADQRVMVFVTAWSATSFSVEFSGEFDGRFKYCAKGTFA